MFFVGGGGGGGIFILGGCVIFVCFVCGFFQL